MDQVLYSVLSGAGAGGITVFLFVQLHGHKIKDDLRKEFDRKLDKAEDECNKYTDAKHDDTSNQLKEIKQMIIKIQEILMNKP